MSGEVYLNGSFLPLAQAQVSVLDRGFLFGDGVYEVIPCYGGRLFRLAHHLERLDNSLHGIRMQNPLSHAEWQAILERLVAQHDFDEQSVYLQVTRGAAATRDHAIPPGIKPTVFAMAGELKSADPALAEVGVAAVTLDDIRWDLCNIKAITLLGNVLVKQQAFDRGAQEAILVRDGNAIEGAASNLFVILDGVITTPPKGPHLLPGITRDLLLELAEANGLAWREAEVSEAQLRDADELWLTSSTKEVMPVVQLDGQPVSAGRPGPVFERMIACYRDYKARIRNGLES